MKQMLKHLRPHLLSLGLISSVIFVVFGTTLTHSFVSLDDYRHLHDNPALSQISLENFKSIWTQSYFGMYAPVTYTFWSGVTALSKAAGNGDLWATPFHLSNILLHVFNALLVYALLVQLGLRKIFATLAALFFSLHPVQVESVAWISSFRDLLAGFWGLVFLNVWAQSLCLGKINISRVAVLTLVLLLAFLSKPSAVTLVGLAVLVFYSFQKKSRKSDFLILGFWGLIAIAIATLAKSIQPDASVDLIPSFGERMVIALQALYSYATHIFWPWGLTPDYGLSPTHVLKTWQNGVSVFLTSTLAAVSLAAIIWFSLRKKTWALGLLFALIGIVPYSGLVIFNFQNVSTVADRYLYIAMIGVAWCLASLLATPRLPQKLAMGLGAGIVCLFSALSFQQNKIWKSDESLFTHMLQQNSRSFYAYGGLGNLLLMQGRFNEALPLLQKAVELRPSYPQAVTNLGRIFELQGKPQDALPKYIQAINIDPNFVGAYVSLADLLLRAGRLMEARETVYHGFEIAPNSPDLKALLQDIENQQKKSP